MIQQRDIGQNGSFGYWMWNWRLVRAVFEYFNFVEGVDISKEMIEKAKGDNRDLDNVKFNVVDGIDLKLFPDYPFEEGIYLL